jgi:Asp-tRNA(Asn)/Glu-tRNA(Gln) amidotransferase A subunit family amidase
VGIRTYSRPLDVIGPICRSVEDATLFMRGFTQDPRFDTAKPLTHDVRVGVWRTKDWDNADPAAIAVFEQNLEKLSTAGVRISTLSMPPLFEKMGDAQDVIMAYDLAREYAAIKRDHAEKCDPELLAYLELGETYSDADYSQALDEADACRRAFYDLARDLDVVAMPSTLGEAPLASSTGSSSQPLDYASGLAECGGSSARIPDRRVREGGCAASLLCTLCRGHPRQHGAGSLRRPGLSCATGLEVLRGLVQEKA